MDLNTRPPWSNRALRRLGAALRDGTAPPSGGPSYTDMLGWHTDLADEVQNQIRGRRWAVTSQLLATSASRISTQLVVSSRAKTLDTLVDKLRRQPDLQLNATQDVAGVRIDADLLLDEQTALAREIGTHFGAGKSVIHDLRDGAHAGYRAVHVWLRLPAGRVEIQVRTTLQSVWANAYEALGDVVGRGIRYGELLNQDSNPEVDLDRVRHAVQTMQELSVALATTEHDWQDRSKLYMSGPQLRELRTGAVAEAMASTAAVLTIGGGTREDGG